MQSEKDALIERYAGDAFKNRNNPDLTIGVWRQHFFEFADKMAALSAAEPRGYLVHDKDNPDGRYFKQKPSISDDDMSEYEIWIEPLYTAPPAPTTANPLCCMCGKNGLSTAEGDGGTECELSDGRWVCSAECWDRAVEPAPPGATRALVDAANDVIVSASDTYKKRNGHIGSFEDESGEKCWIVPFDAFEGLRSALSAQVQDADETLTETCERCQGNGEIVTDWERYRHPHENDVGDEAVAECPDCNGEGEIAAQAVD
jgi:hypothetical protein